MINPGHNSFKSQDHEESIIVVAKKLTGKLGGGGTGEMIQHLKGFLEKHWEWDSASRTHIKTL